MDYFGMASETDYFKEKLSRAQVKIKQFPKLYEILGKFDQATKDNHYENTFLNLAGADTTKYDSILKNFDDLIKEILTGRRDDNLINLIKSFGEKHFQRMNELDFFTQLKEKEGVSDIKYEERGQKHDFKFSIDKSEFNVELTSLGKGKIEQKINEAFTLSAQTILEDLPDNTLVKIEIITDKLGEIGEGISPSDISKTIIENFNKIKVFCLACRNDSVSLEKNAGSSDKTLWECKDYFYYEESKNRIAELSKSEDGINYLKNTKLKEFLENPIDHVMIFDKEKRMVEINAQKSMLSSTEALRKASLVRQLKKNITGKLKKAQLKGQLNPFIAFHFEDFAFHNYYLPNDSWGQDSLNELIEIVKEVFKEAKEKEVLGVLFYFQKFNKSAFIQNPNIEIDSKIIDKMVLLRT